MLYELRTYQAGGGRIAEMESLLARDCTPVIQRARMPRPLGAWHALAGPRLPGYLWILGWESLEQRNGAWAAFGADPQWQALRKAAHEQTELTVRVDTQFMAAWPDPALVAGMEFTDPSAAYQLHLLREHTGQGGAARAAFLGADKPAIEEAGGRIEAGFDWLSGDDLPVAAVLVRWPDAAACMKGMRAYDSSSRVKDARVAERAKFGFDLFNASDRYLMVSAQRFG